MPELAIAMTLIKPAPGGKSAEDSPSAAIDGSSGDDFSQIFNALLAQSVPGVALPQTIADAPLLAVSPSSAEDAAAIQLPSAAVAGADSIATLTFLPVVPQPQPQLAVTAMEQSSAAQAGKLAFARDAKAPFAVPATAQALFDPSLSDAKAAADFAANGTFLPGVAEKLLSANEVHALPEETAQTASDAQVTVSTAFETTLRAPSAMVEQPAVMSVQPRIDHAEWKDAFGQQIVWMANQQHQQADIQLNPPNLGPVEVRLTLTQDQASVMFISQHAAVRDAIQSALPRLNEMLANSGLTLGNVFVGSEAAQQQAFGEHPGQSKHGIRDLMETVQSGAVEQGVMRLPTRHNGMVDLFA